MPIRVVVPLPGPFVYTPRRRSRRGGASGGDGASGEEILVGIFLVAVFAGWTGIYYAFQHSVALGVLATIADLGWLVLLARGWLWLLKNDEIDEDEKVMTTAVVVFFALGLPVLWLNAMAWWIPPLGVAANLSTIAALGYGVQAYRGWTAEQQRIAEAEADAAEVAAIQAEIDAQEAELARLRRVMPAHPSRRIPRGHAPDPPGASRTPQMYQTPPLHGHGSA